jgi:hypothetical protein
MSNIFDLEQSIMKCWNVVDDIDLLYRNVCDRSTPFTEDEIANLLLGMKQLYQLKFEECFEQFEMMCKDYHQLRKFKESKSFTDIKEQFE